MHSETVDETACEYPALTGPSVSEGGLTQLKPAVVVVAVGVTVTVGDVVVVRDGVADADTGAEGDGVAPGCKIVNTSPALRWLIDSEALIVCLPIAQPGLTLMVIVKVPSPLTGTVLPDRGD